MSEQRKVPLFPASGLAQPGDIVYIVPEANDRQNAKFYRLTDREILTLYIFGQNEVENQSFGTITSGSDSSKVEILDMQPNKDHIYQMRFGIYGAAQLYLNIPTERSVGGLDNQPNLGSTYRDIGYYDMFNSPVHKLMPYTEKWFTYHYYPSFKLYNPHDVDDKTEIVFRGAMFNYREVVDKTVLSMLDNGRLKYRYVNMSGLHHRKPQ